MNKWASLNPSSSRSTRSRSTASALTLHCWYLQEPPPGAAVLMHIALASNKALVLWLCLLTATSVLTQAQHAPPAGSSETNSPLSTADLATNYSTACKFLIRGQSSSSTGAPRVQSASIVCTGRIPVQMQIAPDLERFQSAFEGKSCSPLLHASRSPQSRQGCRDVLDAMLNHHDHVKLVLFA